MNNQHSKNRTGEGRGRSRADQQWADDPPHAGERPSGPIGGPSGSQRAWPQGSGDYGRSLGYGSYDEANRSPHEHGGDGGRYVGGSASPQQQQPGRAPRGYARSDERVKEDLIQRIVHEGMDASELEVEVQNGEVTLSGSVQDRQLRLRLEHLADGVNGVNDVHNNIRVKREASSSGQAL